MENDIRINKNYPNAPQPQVEMNRGGQGGASGSKMPWIILVIVIIALVAVGVMFRDRLFGGASGEVQGVMSTKPSGYQSVFLTNGQVYFGKIANETSQYVTLSDIYYLQVTQPPLQGSQQNSNQQQQSEQQPQVSLVKLGNELHGPVDSMKINRDQILFFEDMKDDSRVMQAIREYKANPNAGAQAPANQNGAANNSQQPTVNGATTTNNQK